MQPSSIPLAAGAISACLSVAAAADGLEKAECSIRFVEHAGYLWQMSGDSSSGPYPPTKEMDGCRVPGVTHFDPSNSFQNGWRLSIADAIANGARWELSQNSYHDFPYFLVSFRHHLDDHRVAPFSLPEGRWWGRYIDGPGGLKSAQVEFAQTPTQYTQVCSVGTKLVIGPDVMLRWGEDPLLLIYDTRTDRWSHVPSPADRDLPGTTLYRAVGIESLGEVWLIGTMADFAQGEWNAKLGDPAAGVAPNAGRRFARIKV